MEMHQNLLIELSSSIPDFIACLQRHLPDAWSRNLDLERDLKGAAHGQQFCFVLTGSSHGVPVYVWLAAKSPTLLYISNVIPHEGRLSYAESNKVLQMFVQEAVTPAASECGALVDLSAGKAKLEDLLSQPAAQKLQAFSRSANKSSAAAHPSDLERWQVFLIEAHRSGWEMTTYQLGRWLSEEEGWPEDSTAALMLEYEFAHGLLRAYDQNRS